MTQKSKERWLTDQEKRDLREYLLSL